MYRTYFFYESHITAVTSSEIPLPLQLTTYYIILLLSKVLDKI